MRGFPQVFKEDGATYVHNFPGPASATTSTLSELSCHMRLQCPHSAEESVLHRVMVGRLI